MLLHIDSVFDIINEPCNLIRPCALLKLWYWVLRWVFNAYDKMFFVVKFLSFVSSSGAVGGWGPSFPGN